MKSQAIWWERLASVELKGLLSVARLPHTSSDDPIPSESSFVTSWTRLRTTGDELASCYSQKFTQEQYVLLDSIRDRCRPSGMAPLGDQYELVCRILEQRHGSSARTQERSTFSKSPLKTTIRTKKKISETVFPPPKRRRTENNDTFLDIETLRGLAASYRKTLNDQVDARLKWKSWHKSMNMNGIVGSGRVDIDCPEPKVFLAMFDAERKDGGDIIPVRKYTRTSSDHSDYQLRHVFKTNNDFKDAKLCDKSYRNGAWAKLKVPAEAIWQKGRIAFSFQYVITAEP